MMNDSADTVTFDELDDGDEFEYGGRRYEKDSVPDAIQGIIENALCLEDMTGAMFNPDDEVEIISS